MAEGIDISLFDDGGGESAQTTGAFDARDALEQIRSAVEDAQFAIVAAIQSGGDGGGEGLESVGAGAGGQGGMFSSALGKAGVYLAVFNQAIQGVQKAFGMLQSALSSFADVNATVAIAFERLQLFLRGVLVVLSEALAPVLDQLTNVFKELIATVLTLFVDVFMALRPVLMDFLEGLKQTVQWFNRFLGIKPLDIEEQGLRRSATGVANVLSQFASAAANPQGQAAVNVNIQGNDMGDWEGMMNNALAWGMNFKEGPSSEPGFFSKWHKFVADNVYQAGQDLARWF